VSPREGGKNDRSEESDRSQERRSPITNIVSGSFARVSNVDGVDGADDAARSVDAPRADDTAQPLRVNTVWPSPARIEAPEPAAWLPILVALDAQTREYQLRGPLVDLPTVHLSPRRTPVPLPEPDRIPVPKTAPNTEPIAGLSRAKTTPASRHHWWHTVVLVVTLAVVVAGLPYFLRAPVQHNVTLLVDGVGATHVTRSESVAALLAAVGIELRTGDRIEPALGAALGEATTVTLTRAFPVTVVVDGVRRSVRTPVRSVAELRDELDLPAELVAIDPPRRLRRGSIIAFGTPHEVRLVTDGVEGAVTSTALTVGALLDERGVVYDESDLIDPALGTPITSGLVVSITYMTTQQVTEDVAVPFAIEEHPDPSLDEGKRQTTQPGLDGLDRATHQLTLVGDTLVGRQLLGTVRVNDPQNEIVSVGTKPFAGSARQSGRATWYATLYQPGTCAHLHLDFGTIVRVVNTATGASALCRVADRGPEAWTNNIIDLSPDVFEQLAPLSAGRILVRLDH